MLRDDHLIRITAESVPASRRIGRVVGKGGSLDAILFAVSQTGIAGAAGIDHAAHTADVANSKLGYRAAHRPHPADDLMARDARIPGRIPRCPCIAHLVDIGMTDPAIQHVQQYVIGTNGTALDLHPFQRTGGACGAVGAG